MQAFMEGYTVVRSKRGWDKTLLWNEKAGEILRRVKFHRLYFFQ
ncbi:hypothetical protein ABLO26_28980 [Neobacillus sp. 179-J 1A1 HS]